jgi:ABC-type transport system substrate-binding protein
MVEDTKKRRHTLSRRTMLGSAAAGGTAMLAGCNVDVGGGGGGGNGNGVGDLEDVEDQTLHYFTQVPISDVTWLGTGVFPAPQGGYTATGQHWNLTMQNEMRGYWLNGWTYTGEFHGELYESVDISSDGTELTISIRDDANWSNGDPVTSTDPLGVMLAYRLYNGIRPLDDIGEHPSTVTYAVTDYETVDDKTLRLLSEPGAFNKIIKQHIWCSLTVNGGWWAGTWNNTAIEPYDEYLAALEDWFDMAKNGEIYPWGADPEFDIFTESSELLFGEYGWSETPEENDYDNHWETYFRDPDNVVTNGAWKLDSINGEQNIVLVPNEEHYARDQVNFGEIKIHARESERSSRAALSSGNQDYFRGNVPVHIANAFPEKVEERRQPSDGGLVYGFNHKHRLFNTVEARQALMYAVDNDRVARAVHTDKFTPVTVPGGHAYTAEEILGADWIDENLTTYGYDVERASELMDAAGFSDEGGNWVDEEGEQLSITIPTSQQPPTLAPAYASQLNDFGIDTTIQTYSLANYEEQWNNGEFNIFESPYGAGFPVIAISDVWNQAVATREQALNWYNIYPEEQYDEGLPRGFDEIEELKVFTIEAPPIGEPDGALQTWRPATKALEVKYPESPEAHTNLMRDLAWLDNWYMPVLPIANGVNQHFLNTENWIWPEEDSETWSGVGISSYQPEDLLAWGRYVGADPDNPR